MRKLIIAALILFSACATTRTSDDIQPGDAENAIRRANAGFVEALRIANVDALVNAYAPSAVVLPPNMPPINGRDAIRQFWSGFVGAGSIDGSITTDDVMQSGDLAVETGHYELTITPKGGGAPIHDSGKYLVAWRKIGGQWKMSRDMTSSNGAGPH